MSGVGLGPNRCIKQLQHVIHYNVSLRVYGLQKQAVLISFGTALKPNLGSCYSCVVVSSVC
jgi:hypothetical protein